MITGGMELAPLLAARRRHDNKYPLHSSDVTKIYDPKSKQVIFLYKNIYHKKLLLIIIFFKLFDYNNLLLIMK